MPDEMPVVRTPVGTDLVYTPLPHPIVQPPVLPSQSPLDWPRTLRDIAAALRKGDYSAAADLFEKLADG